MTLQTVDFKIEGEILYAIYEIERILNCNILSRENYKHPLFKAAFIQILISLRDLTFKSERYFSKRIDFTEDVPVSTPKMPKSRNGHPDITDLIIYFRNAICHPDSDSHIVEGTHIRTTFFTAFGKCNLIQSGQIEVKSLYADDICFFFGDKGIYLKRHIIRAFQEVKQIQDIY